MITSCPCSASSRTPPAVSATRHSSSLISVGTPTFTAVTSWVSWTLVTRCSPDQLPRTQGEPELDPVLCLVEVAPGQLLDAADPVAQGMPVAIEIARRPLPLAVALDERLERAQQLRAVLALAVGDRGEQVLRVGPQGVVVLQGEEQGDRAAVARGGEEQGERAEVAVGGDVGCAAVGHRGRGERATRLVESSAQRRHRVRAAGG